MAPEAQPRGARSSTQGCQELNQESPKAPPLVAGSSTWGWLEVILGGQELNPEALGAQPLATPLATLG